MTAYDRIFENAAHKTMTEFDLDKFKKSHPSLYEAIMKSMHSAAERYAISGKYNQ